MSAFHPPQVHVEKLPETPNRWMIASDPCVEVPYERLADIYTNVRVGVIERSGIVHVVGTTGAVPDSSVEEALRRLTVASYYRAKTDENPPKTWRAVSGLVAQRSPEARGIAAPYAIWNYQMALLLWKQAEEEIERGFRYVLKQHADARFDIDAALRRMLADSPKPGKLE